jgi:phosphopantetheinyl transferase
VLDHWLFAWPQMPGLPPPGQPVLIRLTTTAPRQQARQEVRAVLRRIIAAWSGLRTEAIALRESARGPILDGDVAGHSLAISLSYSEPEAWVGLVRGGIIGVDAISATTFAELEMVARLYLGPNQWESIRQSPDPARAFALAWTVMEARLKCRKHRLTEWPARDHRPASNLEVRQHVDDRSRSVVAVVTGPQRDRDESAMLEPTAAT